jgi:hypothetical protein
VNVDFAESGIDLLQTESLCLWKLPINKREREDVERSEDEIGVCSNTGNSNGPHLTNDDGAYGSARSGDTKALGANIIGEDLISFFRNRFAGGGNVTNLSTVYPRGWTEANGVSEGEEENEEDVSIIRRRIRLVRIGSLKSTIDLIEILVHHIDT